MRLETLKGKTMKTKVVGRFGHGESVNRFSLPFLLCNVLGADWMGGDMFITQNPGYRDTRSVTGALWHGNNPVDPGIINYFEAGRVNGILNSREWRRHVGMPI